VQQRDGVNLAMADRHGPAGLRHRPSPPLTLKRQSCGRWSASPELTTKPDHNGIRQKPILADTPWPQSQASDGKRQSARILQAGGHLTADQGPRRRRRGL